MLKKLLAGCLALVVGVILFTGWALESGGVAIIQTTKADGSSRSTHVWFAEPDGEIWIEAGTPENGWYIDVQREPIVSFAKGDQSAAYEAQTIPGKAAHRRIRTLLLEKYGIRDWWVGVLFDTTKSIAVRLVPTAASQSD